MFARLLANPTLYHFLRQVATGGIPFKNWVKLCGLTDPQARVGDIGCGPADILSYVPAETKPAFYLGIDMSSIYLDSARAQAARRGIAAEFVELDLTSLVENRRLQEELVNLLVSRRISQVILIGVIHHIDDQAARTVLDLAGQASSVQRVATVDMCYQPGRWVNNWHCRHDRGQCVRTEPQYDALMAATSWPNRQKFWTSPGLPLISYLHYVLTR
jgi:hypothetical protein